MDEIIKKALNLTKFQRTGRGGGGSINEGDVYDTDHGQIFVKRNANAEARVMFDGEYQGLNAILQTETVRVPKPLMVLDNPKGGAVLVMEYIDMKSLSQHSIKLGQQLAQLHLHNERLLQSQEKRSSSDHNNKDGLTEFGFHCPTCCGIIPQDNTWNSDWVAFFTTQRLQFQIDLLMKKHSDQELKSLWSQLQLKIPQYFNGIDVKPALLHGDLWGGNAAETVEGPVIFDAAAFYGHAEYDLAIAKMFGGFSNGFFESYHQTLPKAQGFDARNKLYQLFHYLNHWNHFGGGYRTSSISIMKSLVGH